MKKNTHSLSLGIRGRIGAVVAVSAAAALLLSACSSGSVTSNGNASDGTKKTTVTVWNQYTGTSATEATKIIDAFNRSQDKYTVEAQFIPYDTFTSKLINAVKDKTAPNMVLGDGNPQQLGQTITSTKAILPLDKYLSASSSSITKKNFTEGMLSSGVFSGATYSLPTDAGDFGLVYNKQMFKEAGISSPPKTWTEFASDAKKLTKGTTQYGAYLPICSGEWPVYNWEATLWSAGGEILNSSDTKVEFNNAAGVKALTAWTDLVKNGTAYPQCLSSSTDNGATAALTAKKAAMVIDGAGNLPTEDKALGKDNVGVAALPGIKKDAMNLGTDNSYILKGTKAQDDGAWTFLENWLKPTNQAQWDIANGYLPTNTQTADNAQWKKFLASNPRIGTFASQLSYARTRPSIAAYSQISLALSQQLEAAMLQQTSPQDALNAAAKQAQTALTGSN
jgi:multiple sugar transport system substrate-binding protein